uniref:Uncharacterized protein LOC111101503 isoform X1 n=1 Tax=Crassostrea virginica TaxID=6565 RepID=A0A8B8AEX9_CRAVI|nr:uncharacterized protein LOC111101503 isoform X1 [Crassostrea virginica]
MRGKDVFYCLITTLITSFTMISAADSCPISLKTVIKVESCPKTEKEWVKNAIKLRCETYASQCSEPGKLKYHCAINASGGLVEVCAYEQNILYGQCTEYSESGNLIMGSENFTCYNITNNRCPDFYLSTKAYKYPECYLLIKKTTEIQQPAPTNEQSSPSVDLTTASNISHEKTENESGIDLPNFAVTVLSVVIAREILP